MKIKIAKRASALFTILLFILFSAGNVFADFADGDSDTDTTSGLVGIGETTPLAKLEVGAPHTGGGDIPTASNSRTVAVIAGSGDDTNLANSFQLMVQDNDVGTAGEGGGIGFQAEYDSTAHHVTTIAGIKGIRVNAASDGGSDSEGRLAFYARAAAGALGEHMSIRGSGNIGIGTTSPSDKLTVTVASGINPGIKVVTSGTGITGGASLILNSTSEAGSEWKIISNNPDNQGGAGALSIYNTVDNLNRVTIQNGTGNVGIGTTTPGSKLEIADSSYTNLINLTRTGAGSIGLKVGDAGGGDVDLVVGLPTSGSSLYMEKGDLGVGTSSPATRLDVRGNVSLNKTLYVLENGNVGIGTTTPNEKLSVAGNASINNTLYITENGRVGIGKASPSVELDVNGSANITGSMDVIGAFTSSGQFAGSSIKLKKDVKELDKYDYKEVLEKVNELQLVRFRYNYQDENETKTIGIIAENSPKEVLDSNKASVNTMTYSSYALAAIKAQQDEINALKEEVNRLKNQNKYIMNKIEEMQ